VKDNIPTIGKLDLKTVKCIFVGYSDNQKGYVYWSPIERRLFVSMDVIFRESELYPLRVTSPFDDSPDTSYMRWEGDSSTCERLVHVGMMSYPILIYQMMPGWSVEVLEQPAEVPEQSTKVSKIETVVVEDGGASTQGELRVYVRRRK
jgi:hypothetical protein